MWRCIMVACNGLKTVEHQVAPFHSFSYLLARRKFKPKFMTNTMMTACGEIVMHMRQNGSSWRTWLYDDPCQALSWRMIMIMMIVLFCIHSTRILIKHSLEDMIIWWSLPSLVFHIIISLQSLERTSWCKDPWRGRIKRKLEAKNTKRTKHWWFFDDGGIGCMKKADRKLGEWKTEICGTAAKTCL